MRTALAALAAAGLTLGCVAMATGTSPPDPGAAPRAERGAPVLQPPIAGAPAPAGGASTEMLAAIRADAAQRAGVDAASVQIRSVQTVTWRDAALGCPRPDMAYAQVLVPGWRVLVTAAGQTLNYHASRRGQWLCCPSERVQEPLPGGGAT